MTTEPPYLAIAAELRRRVRSGELSPGDRVPSTRAITREWGVAMATATKALGVLRQEGLVRPEAGVGTVVVPLTGPDAHLKRGPDTEPLSRSGWWRRPSRWPTRRACTR